MALVDIYQVTQLASMNNRPANNVYHVERLDPGFDATNINQAFIDSLQVSQLALQNPVLSVSELQCFSLGNSVDFENLPQVGKVGTRLGSQAAQFIAFAFRFPTLDRDIRSGRKRFGGASEEISSGNDLAPAFITDMNTHGANMIANWEEASAPGVGVCRFVIVKRILVINPVTGAESYRLPETDGELQFYAPTAFISNVTLRSQNSRKEL